MSTHALGPSDLWHSAPRFGFQPREQPDLNGVRPPEVDAYVSTLSPPSETAILELSGHDSRRQTNASRALTPTKPNIVDALGRHVVLDVALASHAASVVQYLDTALVHPAVACVVLDRILSRPLDPRPLLRKLRAWLAADSKRCAVVVEHHAEFAQRLGAPVSEVLRAAGFAPGVETVVAGHVVVRVHFDASQREQDLSARGLAAPGDRLVLTLEHADARVTGGIGTYVRALERLLVPGPVVLFVGDKGLPAVAADAWLRERGWLSPSLLGCGSGPLCDQALEATLHALFLYHEVRLIEYQECSGHFAFVPQAKRVGLVPPDVETRVLCHGPEEHLERNERRFFIPENTEVNLREKACVELSDSCIIPTEFMGRILKDEFGMRPRGVVVQHRLPFHSARPRVADWAVESAVDTLVFFGAPSGTKGFPDFCEAIRRLWTEPALADVRELFRRIVLIGPEALAETTRFPEGLVVDTLVCSHEAAMHELAGLVGTGLIVLPYRGDNHPYSVLEVIDSGHVPILCHSGGIPELVPKAFHDHVLHEPGPQGIVDAIARRAREGTLWDRETSHALRDAAFQEQASINRSFAALSHPLVEPVRAPASPPAMLLWLSPARDANPNTIVEWLRHQTLRPSSVWIPHRETEGELAAMLVTTLAVEFLVHTLEVRPETWLSQGLARAMDGIGEDTLVCLGPEHVPSSSLAATLGSALAWDETADIVTPWIASKGEPSSAHLRPLGEGIIASVTGNTLGSLTFAARSASLRKWLRDGGRNLVASHPLTLLGSFVERGLRIAGYPQVLAWGPAPAPARTFSEREERAVARTSLPRHESRALERLLAERARASRAGRRITLAQTFRLSLRDLLADQPAPIAVHGAGDNGLILAELLEDLGLEVATLTDQYPDRTRLETHSGIGVTSLSEALAAGVRAFVVSSSQHEVAMRRAIETAARAAGVTVTLYLPHSGRYGLGIA